MRTRLLPSLGCLSILALTVLCQKAAANCLSCCYDGGTVASDVITTTVSDPSVTWDDPSPPTKATLDQVDSCDNPAGKMVTSTFHAGYKWEISIKLSGEVSIGKIWKVGGEGSYTYGEDTSTDKAVECRAAPCSSVKCVFLIVKTTGHVKYTFLKHHKRTRNKAQPVSDACTDAPATFTDEWDDPISNQSQDVLKTENSLSADESLPCPFKLCPPCPNPGGSVPQWLFQRYTL